MMMKDCYYNNLYKTKKLERQGVILFLISLYYYYGLKELYLPVLDLEFFYFHFHNNFLLGSLDARKMYFHFATKNYVL